MAIIRCKMCGGEIELSADKTFGTCDYCGSTMTFPKVDSDQRAAAFNRGNHFRRIGEFDKALAVYERIVREDDTDAEAHWCCALCRFGIEYVEDPATYEYLPTCHRASFDSFLEDVDYLAAVEHSDGLTRRQYQKDAAKIAEVQRGILATSQSAEPFDVFICYKESDENGDRTRDSLLAQDIYYQLTEQGRKVFFARITLEDVVGKQYEPYIFAALNSARVMVVVGTKPEHLNAVWVKNEWSRFLAMMKKDHHKLLLPCYRDMDPYDMPEQLAVLQSYDMSKIGFIQDLTRGIAKVLDAEKKSAAPKETVVVQQAANSNVTALLKRGNMALEDEDWSKANDFFDQVLNMDAENAEAYLGLTLATAKQPDLPHYIQMFSALPEVRTSKVLAVKEDQDHIGKMVSTCTIPNYVSADDIEKLYRFDCYIDSAVSGRKAELQRIAHILQGNRNLARAMQYASVQLKQTLETAIAQIQAAHAKALEEAMRQEASDIEAKKAHYTIFLSQADEQAKAAKEQGDATRTAEEENERQRKIQRDRYYAELTAQEKRKKAKKIAGILFASAAAIVVIVMLVISKANSNDKKLSIAAESVVGKTYKDVTDIAPDTIFGSYHPEIKTLSFNDDGTVDYSYSIGDYTLGSNYDIVSTPESGTYRYEMTINFFGSITVHVYRTSGAEYTFSVKTRTDGTVSDIELYD